MRESAIEMPVVSRAKAAGYFERKVQWPGRKGAPDRVFSREDRGTVWIEFKAPGEKPRRSQVLEHERMRAAGMEVHVCDNIEDALRILWILPGSNNGPRLDDGMGMI